MGQMKVRARRVRRIHPQKKLLRWAGFLCDVWWWCSTTRSSIKGIYQNLFDTLLKFHTYIQVIFIFFFHWICYDSFRYKESSSGVVVGSTGAYGRLSGHPAGPVLGWVARVECPVPKHYTCQAVRSGFRESFSWLSIVLRMRRKIEVPPT